jgi:signal transduction histidine kinase
LASRPTRLPHILEEFTQGSEEIARPFGGSGLGLSIVRKLLRLYGSELHVASTVGQGSTFSFLLPLPRAGAAGPRGGMSVHPPGAPQHNRPARA